MKKYFKLGEICEIIMGQSPSSETYNSCGDGLPFFQGKSEFGEVFPTVKVWCSFPQRIAEPGDILISVRAPVGPTNLVKDKCCIGRGLAAIRPNTSKLNRDFLWLQLQHLESDLVKKGQGSTFEAISTSDLKALSIYLPDLKTQKIIAEKLLDQLNRVKTTKDATKQILEDLNLLPKKILSQVFNEE